ncbi:MULTISPECIES: NUDIX hydrolase [unclassified Nocardioides]|uniref:NUDIX hydrolase n=1 Tax=unclassified Nocardioides TaxID=2615069 RepID=UPI0036069687
MPIPPFVSELRALIGTHPLWLPGVTAVIRRDDDLLLTRRADNGEWSPVTGIVDPEEEPAVSAAREALEETGVEVTVDRLASVGVIPDVVYENGDRAAYLDLTFGCTWVAGEARVADDENVDVRWWPIADLPAMSSSIRQRIDDVLAAETAARFRI